MKSDRLVIIGNSGAAVCAIKSIRETGRPCSITVVSREKCVAYSPVLTTYYIGHQIEESRLFLVDDSFYRNMGVELLLGKEVIQVDPDRQSVALDDQTSLSYDLLLIASGSSANKPRLESAETDSVFTLRTIEDAKRIRSASRKAKTILFVGGGLVSLQVASRLFRKDVRMIFLVSSDRILSQNLDEEASGIVRRRMERMGITFLFNCEIKEIQKAKRKIRVTTGQNEVMEADLLFVGKGVTPNIRFLPSLLKTRRGVLVSDRLRTNVENIYAAGDVTEGINPLTHEPAVIANWLNACHQGRAAGRNMMGEEEVFKDFIPRNVTRIFDLLISSIGSTDLPPGDDAEEMKVFEPEMETYCRVISRGSTILGASMIGDINDSGLIHSFIREGSPAVADRELLSKNLLRLDGPLASFWERRP
jgi:NAD(P)H-nitrite reductase large subunit